jgi:type IV pilus assembly protein PilM
LGNTIKLPGLPQYLAKNLGFQVKRVEEYRRLVGPVVVSSPSFKDNLSSFAVCYGLVLQGLGQAGISTNLLPREILRARLIRRKKPWAVAVASLLVAALCFNFLFHWSRWAAVHPDRYSSQFSEVENVNRLSGTYQDRDKEQGERFAYLKGLGEEVVGNADGRVLQLELLKAINETLPREANIPPGKISELPFEERPTLHIQAIDSEFFPDLTEWFTPAVKKKYLEEKLIRAAPATAPAAEAPPTDAAGPPAAEAPTAEVPAAAAPAETVGDDAGPTGAGWVIELRGYHYHNEDPRNSGAQYVRTTLLRNLEEGEVSLPEGAGQPSVKFTMKEMGIGYPILAYDDQIRSKRLANPNYDGDLPGEDGGAGLGRGEGTSRPIIDPSNPPYYNVRVCAFVVQFCWQEIRVSKRMEERLKKQESQQPAETFAGGP